MLHRSSSITPCECPIYQFIAILEKTPMQEQLKQQSCAILIKKLNVLFIR